MAGENEREQDERDDDDERDEAPEGDEAQAQGEEAVDPNVPRNRAERRAIAKAARRGRTVRVGDENAVAADGSEGSGDPLIGPNTSIGGDTPKLDEAGPKRPKVPPRTMSKGTGNAEGVPRPWAVGAGDWFTKNRSSNAVTILLTVVVLGGGLFGWRAYSTSREARATGAYAEALKSTFAIIAAEEPGADDPRRDLPRPPDLRRAQPRLAREAAPRRAEQRERARDAARAAHRGRHALPDGG